MPFASPTMTGLTILLAVLLVALVLVARYAYLRSHGQPRLSELYPPTGFDEVGHGPGDPYGAVVRVRESNDPLDEMFRGRYDWPQVPA